MPNMTTCTKCGMLYEASSEETANERERLCRTCLDSGDDECVLCAREGGEAFKENPCPAFGFTVGRPCALRQANRDVVLWKGKAESWEASWDACKARVRELEGEVRAEMDIANSNHRAFKRAAAERDAERARADAAVAKLAIAHQALEAARAFVLMKVEGVANPEAVLAQLIEDVSLYESIHADVPEFVRVQVHSINMNTVDDREPIEIVCAGCGLYDIEPGDTLLLVKTGGTP